MHPRQRRSLIVADLRDLLAQGGQIAQIVVAVGGELGLGGAAGSAEPIMPTVIISIIAPIISEAVLSPPTTMKPTTMRIIATGNTIDMMLGGAALGISGGGSSRNSPSGRGGGFSRGRRAKARVAMPPQSPDATAPTGRGAPTFLY